MVSSKKGLSLKACLMQQDPQKGRAHYSVPEELLEDQHCILIKASADTHPKSLC